MTYTQASSSGTSDSCHGDSIQWVVRMDMRLGAKQNSPETKIILVSGKVGAARSFLKRTTVVEKKKVVLSNVHIL